jgi:endonuclease V-like protein UPF0215 family
VQIHARPHLLGIDDGPFQKRATADVPIVGVVTAGADLVEGVAVTGFPVDGDGATEFLAAWIARLRVRPVLQAIILGGITIAGLGIVDLGMLAEATGVPVLSVTRRDPSRHRVATALRAAGLAARLPLLATAPAALAVDGVFVACAGIDRDDAAALVRASRLKAALPEALRLAHLVARALVLGESRGRA